MVRSNKLKFPNIDIYEEFKDIDINIKQMIKYIPPSIIEISIDNLEILTTFVKNIKDQKYLNAYFPNMFRFLIYEDEKEDHDLRFCYK